MNGIDELQRALPNCIVFASHVGLSPAPPTPGSSDRDWAQWLRYQVQGSRETRFHDLDPETGIGSYDELPPVDFHIVQLSFDSDLRHLRNHAASDGRPVGAQAAFLQEASMPAFAGLGDLKQLEESVD